ncbi:hypothetical protein DDI_1911 [Dickeya dianthicola RNS04.9]|nr:hypothetical protein DDI_1911 [Dickeya dianthicola RNS04.9]
MKFLQWCLIRHKFNSIHYYLQMCEQDRQNKKMKSHFIV